MAKRVPVGKKTTTNCGWTTGFQGAEKCKHVCPKLSTTGKRANHCFKHMTKKSLEESEIIGFKRHEYDIINRLLLNITAEMRKPDLFIHNKHDKESPMDMPDIVWTSHSGDDIRRKIFFEFDEIQHDNNKKQYESDPIREHRLAKAYPEYHVVFVRLLGYADGTDPALRSSDGSINEKNLKKAITITTKLLNKVWNDTAQDFKSYSRIVVNYDAKYANNYLDTKLKMKR
jgi:hypothetical protein